MSKISRRDIEVFVAGAFALWGFRVLIWLPSDFLAPIQNFMWFARIASAVLAGLALPLGLAMLLKSKRGLALAKAYLWLFLIIGAIDLVILVCERSILG